MIKNNWYKLIWERLVAPKTCLARFYPQLFFGLFEYH